MAEHDSHSDSFQIKFPNVFSNHPLGAVRVEDQRFKNWDHYKLTLWQSQLNFAVFCASSACGVYVEHLSAKKPMIIKAVTCCGTHKIDQQETDG